MNNSPNLSCYLYLKGIVQADSFDEEYLESIKKVDKNSVLNHIETLAKFHKSSMGCFLPQSIIKNKIGRTVLYNRTSLRKLSLYFEKMNKNPRNIFEELLQSRGEELIKRAETSLNHIYLGEYLELIKRSMKRNELCIKNSYFDNIRRNGKIEILNSDNICYDMVEIDGLYLFIKLKSKNSDFDYRELIKFFINAENLTKESGDFMEALLSYPYYFMKCAIRYIDRKKEWEEEYYKKRLIKSIEKDGESII
ncbi:MAG: spore coat protein [Bacillota bacterium]|nr:spore coat protein [Bacillota bacterium]